MAKLTFFVSTLLQLDCVVEVHDFHCWALSDGKPIFTAHVVVQGSPSHALYLITELLQQQFEIYHSTVQVEPVKRGHIESASRNLLPCVNEHKFAASKHDGSINSEQPEI